MSQSGRPNETKKNQYWYALMHAWSLHVQLVALITRSTSPNLSLASLNPLTQKIDVPIRSG
jgi:hypothetical protein